MQIRAPTAIRRATPASRATRRRSDYVARKMQRAGYDVTIQKYKFLYYAYTGIPTFSESLADAAQLHAQRRMESRAEHRDRRRATSSRPAASSSRRPRRSSSTSGCTAADFTGFVPGRIALIQRGGCNFGVKVAQRPGRRRNRRHHLQRGQPRPHRRAASAACVDAAGNPIIPTIPVAFTSFAIGRTSQPVPATVQTARRRA